MVKVAKSTGEMQVDYLQSDLKRGPQRRCKIFFRTWWEVSFLVGSIISGGKYHI